MHTVKSVSSFHFVTTHEIFIEFRIAACGADACFVVDQDSAPAVDDPHTHTHTSVLISLNDWRVSRNE